MPLRQNPRRTLTWALLSLLFCLSAAPLDLNIDAQTPAPVVRPMPLPSTAQQSDTDDSSAPPATPASTVPVVTPPAATSTAGTGDAPMPTHPYVLPPTNVRPSAPAIVDETSPKSTPHPIFLPPPPEESPARTTAHATKPAPVPARKTSSRPPPTPKAKLTTKPTATPVATPKANTAPTAVGQPATSAPAPKPTSVAPAVASTPVPMPAPVQAAPPAAQSPAVAPDAAQTTAAPGAASELGASTFGFYAGETRDQIIAAIGKDNILKQQGDILEVAAAPKPDPGFDSFLLIVGPTTGLVKLIATGKDIEDDATGRQMKLQFTSLKTDLAKGYGEPSDNFDFLDVKATHRSPGQFMLALTNNERSLAAYWTKKDFGNQITSISLSGNGLGDDTGYLSIEYEFAAYHNYLAAKK